jgi:hypothetical protein
MAKQTEAPSAAEMMGDPRVQEALEQAWRDSLPADPTGRHEEGGWIYMEIATGRLIVRRAAGGGRAAINLADPPTIGGAVVVGKFHTHPNPSAEGWNPGPSRIDLLTDALHGVPDLIRADDGIHVSGPDSRRGGLTGSAGYPS